MGSGGSAMHLLRAFVLSAFIANRVAASQPDDLVAHHDPRGFTVRYPAGWVAETGDSSSIVIHNRSSSESVIVQPLVAPPGATSTQLLRSAPRRLARLLSDSRVDKIVRVRSNPDEAIATVAFRAASS